MPRRSRPSHRLPPTKGKKAEQPENVLSKPKRYIEKSKDKIRPDEVLSGEEESSQRSTDGELEDSDDEEIDADAPRVSVWEEDFEDIEESNPSDGKRLQNDLQDLPLGALRRAQRLLKQAVAESESESDISPDETARVEWSTKAVGGGGRRNKHAPMETTAKKPVTRKRTVVDVQKIVPRDPRFVATAGAFDGEKFQQSYGFLAERRESELQALRESLTKGRKMVGSSAREVRREREEEVERLERAVKRAESMVNRDQTERVGRDALSRSRKEEAARRRAGKGRWYLKKGEERELLLRARYEKLAEAGGERAVKRAMQKRQRRISQKEKRSRPY